MSDRIVCEHFSLTDSIRDHVMGHISEIESELPRGSRIHIFLTQTNPHLFSALYRTHAWGKEIVVRENGENLYQISKKAKDVIVQNIHHTKDRMTRNRKRAS